MRPTSLPGRQPLRQHWPVIKRLLGILYLGTVLVLVALLGWRLDWPAVRDALAHYTTSILLAGAVLSAASHLAYSGFDLIGRRYTGHTLPTGHVMAITFVSYVATLNLGALIGAIGLRQRLYSHQGLSLKTMAQVFAISIVTNWLGYLTLLGLVFAGPAYSRLSLTGWPSDAWIAAFGVLALASVGLYIWLCVRHSGASIRWRRMVIRLPTARLATAQFTLSAASWLVNAGIIYVLLVGEVPYQSVLLASLAAAFVGLVTHVPAGLGVLEATFIFMLGGVVSVETLIAALLAYRALFYLVPIPLAAFIWWRLERSCQADKTSGTHRWEKPRTL